MLAGFGLILLRVITKEHRTIVIGLDCSGHIPGVRSDMGVGEGKKGSWKRVDTEAIREVFEENQVGGGDRNQKSCFGLVSFEMPIGIQTEMPSNPWGKGIWNSRKGSELKL